jgi:hypothetical protein
MPMRSGDKSCKQIHQELQWTQDDRKDSFQANAHLRSSVCIGAQGSADVGTAPYEDSAL